MVYIHFQIIPGVFPVCSDPLFNELFPIMDATARNAAAGNRVKAPVKVGAHYVVNCPVYALIRPKARLVNNPLFVPAPLHPLVGGVLVKLHRFRPQGVGQFQNLVFQIVQHGPDLWPVALSLAGFQNCRPHIVRACYFVIKVSYAFHGRVYFPFYRLAAFRLLPTKRTP